jgi:hypothetical protein
MGGKEELALIESGKKHCGHATRHFVFSQSRYTMPGAAFSFTERTDVQSHSRSIRARVVSMNAQLAGSFGLIPIQVSKHGENELFPEFSDGVRKWMPAYHIWRIKASSWALVTYECSGCMSLSSMLGGVRYV